MLESTGGKDSTHTKTQLVDESGTYDHTTLTYASSRQEQAKELKWH